MRFVRILTILTALSASMASLQSAEPTKNAIFARPFVIGDVYHVETAEKLRGYVEGVDFRDPKGPRKKFPYKGERTAKYTERVLPLGKDGDDSLPDRVFRIVETLKSHREFDGEAGKNFPYRDAVQRVVLHRGKGESKPYSPDEPLKVEEIHMLTHLVFVPALNGLLPSGDLKVGTKWTANRACLAQLAGLQSLRRGELNCEVKSLDYEHASGSLVQIAFEGVIVGVTEEGEVQDDVAGGLYLDSTTGKIHSLVVEGDRTIFESGKVVGRLELNYKLGVRQRSNDERFANSAVVDIPVDPPAKLTRVLYEYPAGGLSLIHPRSWMLQTVVGARLEFSNREHQIILNVHDDDLAPSAKEYAREVADDLVGPNKDKPKFSNIKWIEEPQEQKKGEPGSAGFTRIGFFEVSAERDGTWRNRYWVLQRGKRGVSLGGFIRSSNADADRLLDDTDAVIRSVKFTTDRNPLRLKPPEEASKKK